jgi:glycosyltransferase involved in cell wall biosynthesis
MTEAAELSTVYLIACDPPTTFIRAHIDRLPANVVPVCGFIPHVGGRPVLSQSLAARSLRKLGRTLRGQSWDDEITAAYARVFRQRPGVVLAEYGTVGARVVDACAVTGLPLVVHFHGFDATVRSVVAAHDNYRRLFKTASAIIGVSKSMCQTLTALGAPVERLCFNPYGVDCDAFPTGDPASAPPRILAVGRLVDKKAPDLTVRAFADVHRGHPAAQLRMIGDGPLMARCRDLVASLNLGEAVTFLGAQSASAIAEEMRRARCFVQHSVEAPDGDCEGTPVAILEAGASGLPVVATQHAGILDVVVENETGFLVPERDVDGMAARLARLVADPELAGRMGRAARARVESGYTMQRHIDHLWGILKGAVNDGAVRDAGDHHHGRHSFNASLYVSSERGQAIAARL